jgi:hypothetical protein
LLADEVLFVERDEIAPVTREINALITLRFVVARRYFNDEFGLRHSARGNGVMLPSAETRVSDWPFISRAE